MNNSPECNKCDFTRPDIALLANDVTTFPNVSGEEPRYESIVQDFERFGQFKSMYDRINHLCQQFQQIYPKSSNYLEDVCAAFTELDMMINLHERLLYPYFSVLRDNQEKHALFDGSIYGVIQVLQNSSDKIRSILNLKQWETVNKECEPYRNFSRYLTELCPKVLAYLDTHDRYIYPEAIYLEEEH